VCLAWSLSRGGERSASHQKKPRWIEPGLIYGAQTICKPARTTCEMGCIGPTDWQHTKPDRAGKKEPRLAGVARGASSSACNGRGHDGLPPALRLRPPCYSCPGSTSARSSRRSKKSPPLYQDGEGNEGAAQSTRRVNRKQLATGDTLTVPP
jgi:hypothetical protein